jgi:hypothetical protein
MYRSHRSCELAVKMLPAGTTTLQIKNTEHQAAIRVDQHSASSRRFASVH